MRLLQALCLLLWVPSSGHNCGKAASNDAGGHTCSGRVDWLVGFKELTEEEAGMRVASEYPLSCWRCGFQSSSCKLPPQYHDPQLQQLQMMNCGKVQKAITQFQNDVELESSHWASPDQLAVWQHKSKEAGAFCRQSAELLDNDQFEAAAVVSLYAWSHVIMDDLQCCDLLRPPFCLQAHASWSTLSVAVLVGGAFLALVFSIIASLTVLSPSPTPQGPSCSPGLYAMPRSSAPAPADLHQELLKHWMKDHSLRGLHGAQHFAESTASLFSALYQRFDFQVDNVRNQFDHLLSLWRSHCAVLADLDLELEEEGDFLTEAVVNEQTLLHEALHAMHAELLEGFLRWRDALAAELQEPLSLHGLGLGGARWAQLPHGAWLDADGTIMARAAKISSKHLAEIAVYLLVWGEAGNLRFMPDVVYFLTELSLSADDPHGEPFYPRGTGQASSPDRKGNSNNLFLARMVRPIYNLVFDEWYDCVDFKRISAAERASGVVHEFREKLPTFHRGFEAFLPPDIANYDDWNEFFASATRLRRGMPRLFESEHGKRFAILQEFNLTKMLNSSKTKTHREVHSLWGVFASTQRIWLLHSLLFFTAICIVAGEPKDEEEEETMAGRTAPVRFAALGLVAPCHALLVTVSRLYTCGSATRKAIFGLGCCCANAWRVFLWLLPVITYAAVRYADLVWKNSEYLILEYCLIGHAVVSVWVVASLLFFSDRSFDMPYKDRPRAPLRLRIIRYFFWFVVLGAKFLVAVVLFVSIFALILDLQLEPLGRATSQDIRIAWHSSIWARDVLIWLWLWFSSLFIFCADTQLWFTVGCTFMGMASTFVQRKCYVFDFALEDAMHKLPERFAQKVLRYSNDGKRAFAKTWNLVVQHMTREHKINMRDSGELCFDYITSEEPDPPVLFNRENCLERAGKHYCGITDTREWPGNKELRWRFLALARGVGLHVPRPYRSPYLPGMTALIPHFEEPILMSQEDLYSEAAGEARELGHLIDYLRIKYVDEFKNLAQNWSVPGGVRNWSRYSEEQWKETCVWASMRLQTLWRTVSGVCKYHDALLLHHELQGLSTSGLKWQREDTRDVFRCLVSMQLYTYFTAVQREQVNEMLERFPSNLKIAYIDHNHLVENGDRDGIHPRQRRRYYSCLIDRSCKKVKNMGSSFRQPLYRIELPGYPILSDGKADNQNHALPFSRGTITQCVDSNQGAYFEQMMLLPCALAEFRWNAKQIVGFPEHITSDMGSVGDFAAGSEMAFCTILQRSYAVLGARMHYGHPDLMNKQFMMQQGGVSKGTRTLNLSEDIFAGLDFMLRGDGREICHKEYFHLAKGRDLGFNSVLKFFSKLSSGSGEQLLTRQMFRLGQLLPLPEALTLYYAHAGYYVTQFLLSWVMPTVMFTWALVLASDCDGHFEAFESSCARRPAAELMGRMLASIYTLALLLLVLLATAAPLFMEEWLERSLKIAVQRLLKQIFTLSFLMFVFQAKIIGFYVINELRYGGAKYISTGRSLPTERRHFIRAKTEPDDFDGLYLDYAVQAFYDGLILLIASVMVVGLGGMSSVNVYRHRLSPVWVCIGLTIISWLYAPFIFNPHQFARRHIEEDRRSLCAFFFKNWGRGWIRWYEECQLKPRAGLSISMLDFNFLFVFLGVSVWFAVVNHKVSMLQVIFSKHSLMEEVAALTLLPPVAFSMVFCMLAALGCSFTSCIRRSCRSTMRSSWDLLKALVPLLAPVVVLLQIAEAALCLDILRNTGRWKDYIAGFILKYLLLEVMIYLAEGLLRSRCARGGLCKPERGLQALYFWVLTNRMFRDMITSTVILVPLLILSYFNSAVRRLCSSFDLHEFLIYRSTGHRARRRSSACGGETDSEPSDEQTSAETSSSDEAAPLPVRAR